MSEISQSLRKEIGQHFIFGFDGYKPTQDVIKLIREYHTGAIILFKRNVKSIEQLHELIHTLQRIAYEAGHAQPLLIGIDQENGLVSAFSSTPYTSAGTQFPGAMALGASGLPSLAYETTSASAREMKMVGINWVFSPVADVNSDPRNPVIGVRSFGEDPNTVASFATAVASALADEGIAPCAKHFPGHGDTHVDSHLALPVIHKPFRELRETELVPFNALATSRIASIMTAHIALPSLHPSSPIESSTPVPPASLSYRVSTALLRSAPPDGLGFSGVVVTDCLEMNAISSGVGVGPGSVQALKAGADVVMICHRLDRQMAALEATYEAITKYEIDAEVMKKSGERIRSLKGTFAGSWSEVLAHKLDIRFFEALKVKNALLSKQAYRKTTRWPSPAPTRNIITKDTAMLVLTPEMEKINLAVDESESQEGILRTAEGMVRNTAGPSYISFAQAIKSKLPQSTHLVYRASDVLQASLPETFAVSIRAARFIIFTTRNAHQQPSAWQLKVLKRVLEMIREEHLDVKIYVLASCAPYDYARLQADEEMKGLPVLCTYEFTKEALEAAANILCGE